MKLRSLRSVAWLLAGVAAGALGCASPAGQGGGGEQTGGAGGESGGQGGASGRGGAGGARPPTVDPPAAGLDAAPTVDPPGAKADAKATPPPGERDAGADTAGAPPPADAAAVGPGGPAASGLEQMLVTRAIGLGYYHSCLVLPTREIRCAGDVANAGDPRIHPPAGLRADQINGAHNGFCVLRMAGTAALGTFEGAPLLGVSVTGKRLTCWGHKDTFFPPANLDMDPIQYGVGYDHGCALNADHSVVCWGQPGTNNKPPEGLKAKTLTVAAFFNCAIKEDDSVVCWGINPPAPPPGLKAKLVAATFHDNNKLPEAPQGTNHACAITLDDGVTCWGTEVEGNLTPPPGLKARDIAVATWDSCALKFDGEPVCWGKKVYDNMDPTRYHPMPAGLHLRGIRARLATYCGIRMDNDNVACWGDEQHDHITFPATGVKLYVP
jgi:hypothetical protein